MPDSTELKSELSKIVVGLGNLDPLRQLSDVASLPSFVHAIQPMLVCEALLRPASDLVKVFPGIKCIITRRSSKRVVIMEFPNKKFVLNYHIRP